jgi:hypothetical protein
MAIMGSSKAALRTFNPPIPVDKAFAALRRYDVGDVNHVMSMVVGERRETATISFSSRPWRW